MIELGSYLFKRQVYFPRLHSMYSFVIYLVLNNDASIRKLPVEKNLSLDSGHLALVRSPQLPTFDLQLRRERILGSDRISKLSRRTRFWSCIRDGSVPKRIGRVRHASDKPTRNTLCMLSCQLQACTLTLSTHSTHKTCSPIQ